MIKKYCGVTDQCCYTKKYRCATHDILNLRYKTPKEIPVVFHNGSKYDYHFIIEELTQEIERQFKCLGENTGKYITFSVPIKKKKIDNSKTSKYKLKFIDGFRFMLSSLATLFDNLYEGLHSDKCTDCKSCLKYIVTKDELLIFNCLKYSKSNKRHFNKDLIKRFAIIYDFCDGDINKFILLSRKGIYPYGYMDSWERFDETFLPDK